MRRRFATCRGMLKPSSFLKNLPVPARCHRTEKRRVPMKKWIMLRVCSVLSLAALFIEVSFLSGDLLAQNSFYQGKTISLIMGTAPGGSSDMMVKSALPYVTHNLPG